ncbi:MAG: TolC family protein [Gemmatimonadota bacterium]|nr:TolC family protein [Gemmatimonadota bacterium]
MTKYSRRPAVLVAAMTGILILGTRSLSAQDPVQVTTSARVARPLSLDDALRAAEASSEEVRMARAGVKRAQGTFYQARSDYLPQVGASLGYTRTLKSQFSGLGSGSSKPAADTTCRDIRFDSTASVETRVAVLERSARCAQNANPFAAFSSLPFGQANTYTLGLSVSENLFNGGRTAALVRAANASRQSADVGLTAARAQLLLDVTQTYYDAALSDRLVIIAEATLHQADTTLSQTQLARQVGNSPDFDVLRAQVTRDNQRPVVIQQRASREIAYMRLKQLLNLPLEEPVVLSTDLGDSTGVAPSRLALLTGTIVTDAPDTATAHRAPVRQAESALRAQESQLTVARSERLPALSVNTQYGKVGYPASGLPAWSDLRTNWTVGATLSVPLFTGGRIRGDELVAEAGRDEQRARLQQVRELSALDTRNALARLDAAQASWIASSGTVEQAGKAYQIADLRYREGISTQIELSDSRILLQQAQANRAQAARDLQVARMRVLLLRDLPLSGTTAGSQNGSQSTGAFGGAQQQTQSSQPRQQQTQTQSTGLIQASQTGVSP